MPDYVHMLLSVQPKYAVSQVVGYKRDASGADLWRARRNFVGQHFWARGYFVSTVGRDGREWSPSVVRVEPLQPEIEAATKSQLAHGRYEISALYGGPGVSARIAEQIAKLTPYAQKQLHYVKRQSASPGAPPAIQQSL